MDDQQQNLRHHQTCSCSNCYNRKMLWAVFVIIFDFLFALGCLTIIVLCTHFQYAVVGYCPKSISNDIMTQTLISLSFFASSILLFVGVTFKFVWPIGMHILKDGLFLILSFILLVVNVVVIARTGTITLFDGAVLGSLGVFALLHAWFILVMVSIGNYILINSSNNEVKDRRYSLVYDIEKCDEDVYL